MELSAVQKSAVLTAIEKALKAESDKARHNANEELKNLYDVVGTDRMRVKIGDTEIGTFSLVFEKESFVVTEREAFDDFCITNGFADETLKIRPEYMQMAAEELATHYPEGVEKQVTLKKGYDKFFTQVDGVMVVDGTNEIVPGIAPKPKAIKHTQFRGIKPQETLQALKSAGMGLDQFLLGDGNE